MTSSFSKRSRIFLDALFSNQFPNASSLAEQCCCSRNTAQRTIYKLRDDYLVPMEYDPSEKGYYLTEKSFRMPSELPALKDELYSLFIASKLMTSFGLLDVTRDIEALWHKFLHTNYTLRREILTANEVLEVDKKELPHRAHSYEIIPFLEAATKKESIRLQYVENEEAVLIKEALVEKIQVKDAMLYFILKTKDGTRRTISPQNVTHLSLSILNT